MKTLNRRGKITLISNVVLTVVLTIVFAVCFIPDRIIPIYNGQNNTAIYNGNRDKNNVSLMFNVYENTQVVIDIVDTLNSFNAKATFFVGGCWADDNENALKKILQSGHEIGNHGYFHKDHKKLTYSQNREEIYLTGVVTEALCGVKPTLFAPPSGSFSKATLDACLDLGYTTIMWSKDTIDWRDKSEDLVFTRATKSIENGDLVLMHPKEHTLKALPKILKFYIDNGFNVVTVGENINGL